jgi:hypothetical protein
MFTAATILITRNVAFSTKLFISFTASVLLFLRFLFYCKITEYPFPASHTVVASTTAFENKIFI